MRIIEGRTRRRGTNRLEMAFVDIDVPDLTKPREFAELAEVAIARQCGEDGKGRTMQIMLGWRDGGPGRHTLSFGDGRSAVVEVTKQGSTLYGEGDTVLARMDVEQPVAVQDGAGAPLFSFTGPPESLAVYDLTVNDATGATVGTLQVSYDDHSWKQISTARDVARGVIALGEELRSWSGSGGTSLKLKVAGTRLRFERPVSTDELTVLVGVCVDIAIGYRRYTAGMRKT